MLVCLVMVRLNKCALEPNQINDLLSELAKVLSPKQSARAYAICSEILGKEEQIMVAKRLAAIVLLLEDFSCYKISRTLKLSESTVSQISHKLTEGEYETIVQSLGKSKTDYFAILNAIDSVLHLGGILPHYNGIDRYRGI